MEIVFLIMALAGGTLPANEDVLFDPADYDLMSEYELNRHETIERLRFYHSIGRLLQDNDAALSNSDRGLLLEFTKYLKDDARDHRSYLEKQQDTQSSRVQLYFAVQGGLIAVFGAFLVWFNNNTRKSIQSHYLDLAEQMYEKSEKTLDTDRQRILERYENQLLYEITIQKPGAEIPDIEGTKSVSGKSILWIESSFERASFPRAMLTEQGITIEHVLNHDDGFARLKTGEYDLIVTDLDRSGKPEIGIDYLKTLKSSRPDTPVIVFSSKEIIAEYGDTAKDSGANAVIHSQAGIIKKINSFLAE